MSRVRRFRVNWTYVTLYVLVFLAVCSIGMVFITAFRAPPMVPNVIVLKPGRSERLMRRPAPQPVNVPQLELEDLRRIEERSIRAIQRLQPMIVGIMSPEEALKPPRKPYAWGGSGIIISPGGLVLSRASISHQSDTQPDYSNLTDPRTETTVFLADGTQCKAKLLGTNQDYDVSLVQLLESGPYPCISLQETASMQPGDWVISMGHLFGFRECRLTPASLGRVLGSLPDGTFMADSAAYRGGCYFDLEGRFVGIASFGVPLNDLDSPDQPVFATVPARRIADLQASLTEGDTPARTQVSFPHELTRRPRLPSQDWTSGDRTKTVFGPLAASLRSSIVTVLHGEIPVGFATVVDEDGLAVTKATVLPPKPQCRLPDETTIDLDVIGVNKQFDLAFIRLPRESVRPVVWTAHEQFPAGTIVAAVGAEETIPVFGIVSVDTRQILEPSEFNYDLPLRVKAQMPRVYGEKLATGFVLDTVYGLAKAAGLRPGDTLSSIAGIPIETADDMKYRLGPRLTGETVPVIVVRNGETLTFEVPLEAEGLHSGRTYRNSGFPIAFEYSMSVPNTACGSPLINLNGEVIGIAVGGSDDRSGWAIPREPILRLLADVKAGRLESWVSP